MTADRMQPVDRDIRFRRLTIVGVPGSVPETRYRELIAPARAMTLHARRIAVGSSIRWVLLRTFLSFIAVFFAAALLRPRIPGSIEQWIPDWTPFAVACLAAVFVLTRWWRSLPSKRIEVPEAAQQAQARAYAQRLTAKVLRPLVRHGWVVLNNLCIGEGEYLDHLVVGPLGVFAIESHWFRKVPVRGREGLHGEEDLLADANAVMARTGAVSASLEHELASVDVQRLICAHGAPLPASDYAGGVRTVHGTQLAAFLRSSRSALLEEGQIQAIAKAAHELLPPFRPHGHQIRSLLPAAGFVLIPGGTHDRARQLAADLGGLLALAAGAVLAWHFGLRPAMVHWPSWDALRSFLTSQDYDEFGQLFVRTGIRVLWLLGTWLAFDLVRDIIAPRRRQG